ncbi:MAG: cell division protein FtsZ [Euryarchaeota archaeon]|nr:cell division protein FtsZ [Euryarchaeota archaeon]
MKSIIEEALAHAHEDALKRADVSVGDQEPELFGTPRIVVIGCGGGGNNTINRLAKIGVQGADLIAVNTDKVHLDVVKADKKVLIGKNLTRGLGAGGYPEVGAKAAELARPAFEELLKDADMVFITAGMGGGTGTGSAPVVAEIAKQMGSIVIGMVTYPFAIERARLKKADEGIEKLRKAADTVVVIDNNRLVQFVPHLPLDQAFSVADEIISQAVKGITETVTIPSLINLDYADVKAIMSGGGVSSIGIGESNAQNRVEAVVKDAMNCPLLDVDYQGAVGALLHISGGPDLTLGEANKIGELVTQELDPNANVIWGARIQEDLEGTIRIMVIMTGVHSKQLLGHSPSAHEGWSPSGRQVSSGIDFLTI